jgi:hypothetical protein
MKKLLVFCVLLTGCATYEHRSPNGELTKANSFLMKGGFDKLRTVTKGEGTNYSRTVSIGTASGETETEKLNDLAKSIAEGAVAGAVKGAK